MLTRNLLPRRSGLFIYDDAGLLVHVKMKGSGCTEFASNNGRLRGDLVN